MSVNNVRGLNSFRAMSFDCYGTLIDWEREVVGRLERLFLGRSSAPEAPAIFEDFLAHETAAIHADPSLPYNEVLYRSYLSFCKTNGLNCSIPDAKEFSTSIGHWQPFVDTVPALQFLEKHCQLFILSNVDDESIKSTVESLGVKFSGIYTAQTIGSYKPDLKNFKYIIDRLAEIGLAKQDILHVSVSIFHDHIPAIEAGLATCWLKRDGTITANFNPSASSGNEVEPIYQFGTLEELVQAYDRGFQ